MTIVRRKAKRRRTWFMVIGATLAVMVLSCLSCICMSTALPGAPVVPTRVSKPGEIVEPTPTSTPQPVGQSRSNPIPMNHVALGGGMSLAITEVLRPACTAELRSNASYERALEAGNEYVKVYLAAECTLSPEEDEQCHLNTYEFELTGSSNLVRDPEWSLRDSDVLEDIEFYSGATVTGALVFQVAQGEDNLILIYEPLLSFLFENEVFFALQ